MKKIVLIALLMSCFQVQAQTFGEWFRQKKTQKQYLLQQIAALKVYTDYLQKGYAIAKDGLDAVGDFKNGEFSLHKDYFNSLKAVNPQIKRSSQVTGIVALNEKILEAYRNDFQKANASKMLNRDELNYVSRVYGRLLDDCGQTLDELRLVTTRGELEMTDDERIRRIDTLYVNMQENYTFCKAFGNETLLLIRARTQQGNDLETSRLLHGIKN